MSRQLLTIVLAAVFCVSLGATRLQADPLPGETMKFIQLPLNGGLPVPVTVPSGAVSGRRPSFPATTS